MVLLKDSVSYAQMVNFIFLIFLVSKIPFSGTMFDQQLKTCQWWFYVDCQASEQFYVLAPPIEERRPKRNYINSRQNYHFYMGRERRRQPPKKRRYRRRIPVTKRRIMSTYGEKKRNENDIEKLIQDIYEVLAYFKD